MADPQPTTSKETAKGMNPDFVNRLTNKESARFLMRILQKADEELKMSKHSIVYDRVTTFTGLDKRAFHIKTLNREIKLSDLKEIERSQIHDRLMSFYFIAKIVPTTRMLYYALFEEIPCYIDIRTFRKYLAKFGYVWLRLPNEFAVIERPKVTFERYFYLRDVAKYREEGREMFYVDEAILSTVTGECYDFKRYNSLKKAAANAGQEISRDDLIKVTYAVSKSGVHALDRIDGTNWNNDEFSTKALHEWVLNKLLPILPPSSIVVLKNDKHRKCEKPTLYSMKSEMTEWLDSNDVPYDEKMSKCDLITLIDNYTSEVDRVNEVESIFNVNGHIVLKLPSSAEKLSVAHHVFNLIKTNAPKLKLGNALDKIFDAISSEQLKAYDENIVELEQETLEIDMKVDEILDDLIAKTGTRLNEADYDSEIPLSDSE